ncbi:hypothetical protein [Dyella tabacisoli]|uniref:Nuclear transport factor 2 family protein n=1 Tax=Dyella tabacisoli TaxID=2282381 RepID=A0A369US95_9GAMM|nr:hypothetical protein [Dyella tabacisoli]RDD83546.1 hypothetical protein DVJ77_02930 [Dyella tabacisoli]
MRYVASGFRAVLLLAYTVSPTHAEEYVAQAGERTISICELAEKARPADAIRAHVRAHFVTDLRHGAFLDDPKCKGLVIQKGLMMSDPVHESVQRFDEATEEHALSHQLVEFEIDVSGTYTPRPAGEFWGNEAKGRLIFERVWSFQRSVSK